MNMVHGHFCMYMIHFTFTLPHAFAHFTVVPTFTFYLVAATTTAPAVVWCRSSFPLSLPCRLSLHAVPLPIVIVPLVRCHRSPLPRSIFQFLLHDLRSFIFADLLILRCTHRYVAFPRLR